MTSLHKVHLLEIFRSFQAHLVDFIDGWILLSYQADDSAVIMQGWKKKCVETHNAFMVKLFPTPF